MGGQESKEEIKPSEQLPIDDSNDHFYFLEEINKVSLKNRRQVYYYWVDPRVYSAENQKYFKMFLSNFKIQSFTSLEGLKSQLDDIQNNQLIKVITAASLPDTDYYHLQNQKKIAQMFVFCGNEERAKLLRLNFDKIKGFGLKCPQVIEVLQKEQLLDNLDIPPCNLLFMLNEDRKTLNKYRLNYYCLTNKQSKVKAKQDFIILAKHLFSEEEEKIKRFQTHYEITKNKEESLQQALDWAFDDSFYWKSIANLPKATTDPKRLAYLRLPFEDLYEAIFESNKKRTKNPSILYLVAYLNVNEIQKLQEDQSLGNFIIFSSFIKGYTKKADAIKEYINKENTFLFEVNFTGRKKENSLDSGFHIYEDKDKQNVIFNIYNFFCLESLNQEQRSGSLLYGALAEAYFNRANQSVTKKRLTTNEQALLRNYDYLQDILKNDDSQANILQIAGYFKESLEVYDRKVQYLKKIKANQGILNKYIILRADAYKINEEFEDAEREYKSITQENARLVCLVHLLELYIKKNDDEKVLEIQRELEKSSNIKRLKQNNPEEAFKAENFIALSWMKKNLFKEALKKLKNLRDEASLYYDERFESIPLIHDIFRNMATCQAKLNNHKEALNLLESTREWQLVCEGESAGLALTETLVQNIYEEIGNKEMANQSQITLASLKQSIGLSENKYLNQSKVLVNLASQNQNKSKKAVNVNQSIVNVNLNQPATIEQSKVEVNIPQKVNINQSIVDVKLDGPQTSKQANINSSLVVVDLASKKQVNVNSSIVDINIK